MTDHAGWSLLLVGALLLPSCTHGQPKAAAGGGGAQPAVEAPAGPRVGTGWAGMYVLSGIGEDTLPARPGSGILAGTYRSGRLFLDAREGFELTLFYGMDSPSGSEGFLTLEGTVFAPEGTDDLLLIVRSGRVRSSGLRSSPRVGRTLLLEIGEEKITAWVGRHRFLFRKSSLGALSRPPDFRRLP